MKRLLLVTKDKEYNDLYLKELYSIFAGYLVIDSFCEETDNERSEKKKMPVADMLLLPSPYSFPAARPYINEKTKIVTVSFTFSKEAIQRLESLPVGTEALTCFKYYSDAHQAAYTLYELGLHNLNLYINYLNNHNLVGKKMDVALISGYRGAVPDNISQVFDLGTVHLSLNTILDIAMSADILCDELEAKIVKHYSMLGLPQNHTSYFFNTSSMTSMSLKAITDCIEYAMIIIDQENQIINFNDQFKEMFKIDAALFNKKISEIPQLSYYEKELSSRNEIKNKLVESPSKNQQFLVSKEKINKNDSEFDIFLILFKDITYIHSLESSFQKQIVKRGHVAKHTFSDIIHRSEKMELLLERCKKIANVDKPVLIIGESGTGKELFAGSMHNSSDRSKYPYVAINCATIPDNLLESELFGYEEGAFTGARKGGKVGLFQTANKGTLFLDEIGELSLGTQAKLLRVLEEKEIMKVGGDEIISIDTRIVAATNRDLKALVESGDFRLDLYYRLNTLTVNIPPLRERVSDIPVIIESFIDNEGTDFRGFSAEAMNFFIKYRWPGNVRELRNCIEYMVSIGSGVIGVEDLPEYLYDEYIHINSSPNKMFNDIVPVLEPSEKRDMIFVLEILKEKPLGRRKLSQRLAREGLNISEYRLRKHLEELNKLNIISFGQGSAGCRITEEGLSVLKKLSETN